MVISVGAAGAAVVVAWAVTVDRDCDVTVTVDGDVALCPPPHPANATLARAIDTAFFISTTFLRVTCWVTLGYLVQSTIVYLPVEVCETTSWPLTYSWQATNVPLVYALTL